MKPTGRAADPAIAPVTIEGAKSSPNSTMSAQIGNGAQHVAHVVHLLSMALNCASSRFMSSRGRSTASSILLAGSMATTLRASAMASSSVSTASWPCPNRTEAEVPPMSSSESSLPATAENDARAVDKEAAVLAHHHDVAHAGDGGSGGRRRCRAPASPAAPRRKGR